MVTRSTRGWWSQRASSACSTRAVVDLPTATLPGDADDERHLAVGVGIAEEGRGRGEQSLPRRHLQVDEPGQRQIHLGDLVEVDLLAEAAQVRKLGLGEDEGHGAPQLAPLVAIEFDVGAGFAHPGHAAPLETCRLHVFLPVGLCSTVPRSRASGSAVWVQRGGRG